MSFSDGTSDKPSSPIWEGLESLISSTTSPPGSDIMADIRDGPKAAERMEFELFDRLAHSIDMYAEEADGDTSSEKHDGDTSDQG